MSAFQKTFKIIVLADTFLFFSENFDVNWICFKLLHDDLKIGKTTTNFDIVIMMAKLSHEFNPLNLYHFGRRSYVT